MSNPFKNNSLASGLLGYILGLVSLAGYNAVDSHSSNPAAVSLLQTTTSSRSATLEHQESDHGNVAFHGIDEDPNGDVVITKSGGKYHSPYGCSSLSRSHETRTVSRSDAEEAGLSACSKCNP